MYRRLIVSATALLLASALPSAAQTPAWARTAPPIRFQEMDRNHDRVITRAEWQGSDQSFRQRDWNGDGILSGNEVRLDPGERAGVRDSYARDYGFDWSPREFGALDRNHDGRIALKEWRVDRALFRRADRNRDNFVSRVEFNRMRQQAFSGAGNGPVGTSGSHSPTYSAGYGRGVVEARAHAREDRGRHQRYDPEGQRELVTADSGYDPRFGPKAEYQAGYRDGWRRGYPEGWRQP